MLARLDRKFKPVPHISGAQYVTAFRASRDLRVEFLTPNRGPDLEHPRRLPAFGVDGQPLRFLDFLIRDPEPAILLFDIGVHVLVPAPQRFAVHKLIVARRRSIGEAKSEKDIRQAGALLEVLVRKRPHELREAWQEAFARGRAWRGLLGEGLGLVRPEIRDQTLKAVDATRSVIPGLDLQFEAPAVGYDGNREVAFCFGKSGTQTIRCSISREALEDHFGANGLDQRGRMAKFREQRSWLQRLFRRKYLAWPVEEVGNVLLRTEEIADLTKELRRRA